MLTRRRYLIPAARLPVYGGLRYYLKLKSIQPANLIGYWPLWEASGATINDQSGQANNGTYTGATLNQPGIGDGRLCPYFDGANDHANLYSADLASDFNPQEGTLAAWAKVYNSAVWTDATARYIAIFGVDVTSNYIAIRKGTTNNTLNLVYIAGSASKIIYPTSSSANWIHLALTWSVSNDQVKAYLNGSQSGSTLTGLGTWSGALNSARAALGSANGTTPVSAWNGYVAHAALWTTPLTPDQILSLTQV